MSGNHLLCRTRHGDWQRDWLIPVDAGLKSDLDAEQEAISLRSLMSTVAGASRLGLVLDACGSSPAGSCFEIIAPRQHTQPDSPLRFNKCSGETWLLVWAPKEGRRAVRPIYRWSSLEVEGVPRAQADEPSA